MKTRMKTRMKTWTDTRQDSGTARTAKGRLPDARDRGSATAELVIVAPIVLVLIAATVVLGRLVLVKQQVVDAARSAAEAAALWPTAPQADEAGVLTASYDLVQDHADCLTSSVSIDTSRLVPGGAVGVTISCVVPSGTGLIPGLPSVTTITVSAWAPIEVYREVG